ncbi:MAG: hypothetical protein ACI8TP_004619 [Acidimicrobiales bacterium]|jgi:hypothetical protein
MLPCNSILSRRSTPFSARLRQEVHSERSHYGSGAVRIAGRVQPQDLIRRLSNEAAEHLGLHETTCQPFAIGSIVVPPGSQRETEFPFAKHVTGSRSAERFSLFPSSTCQGFQPAIATCPTVVT